MARKLLTETLLENAKAYVKNNGLPEEKYQALLAELSLHQKLFRYRYKEKIENPDTLRRMLGLNDLKEVAKHSEILDSWLSSFMGGVVRDDYIGLVCPECLNVILDKPDEGDQVCLACGIVVDASYADGSNFDVSLNRDVTYSPSSPLSWSNGMGGTLPNRQIHRLLNNSDVDFSTFKNKQPELASDLSLFGFALKDNYFFRLSEGYVRKVPLESVDALFHTLDKPLRKYRVSRVSENYVPSSTKTMLTYAKELCDRYNITDQPFLHTLGIRVRQSYDILKFIGCTRPTLRPLVDSIFFLCLLDFKRRVIMVRAKPNLKLDLNLLNLLCDFQLFKIYHKKPNYDTAFLKAYEEQSRGS